MSGDSRILDQTKTVLELRISQERCRLRCVGRLFHLAYRMLRVAVFATRFSLMACPGVSV